MFRLTVPSEVPDPTKPPMVTPAAGVAGSDFAAAAQAVLAAWQAQTPPPTAAQITLATRVLTAARNLVNATFPSGNVSCAISGHMAEATGERRTLAIVVTEVL
jgi:hypothetical protein